MSRFVRHLLCTAVAMAACGGAAGAQLLGQLSLPPVGLPAPVGNVPVAGPVLQDVLGSSQLQQQVVRPTLDTVQGLPQAIAESGRLDIGRAAQDAPAGIDSREPRPARGG